MDELEVIDNEDYHLETIDLKGSLHNHIFYYLYYLNKKNFLFYRIVKKLEKSFSKFENEDIILEDYLSFNDSILDYSLLNSKGKEFTGFFYWDYYPHLFEKAMGEYKGKSPKEFYKILKKYLDETYKKEFISISDKIKGPISSECLATKRTILKGLTIKSSILKDKKNFFNNNKRNSIAKNIQEITNKHFKINNNDGDIEMTSEFYYLLIKKSYILFLSTSKSREKNIHIYQRKIMEYLNKKENLNVYDIKNDFGYYTLKTKILHKVRGFLYKSIYSN